MPCSRLRMHHEERKKNKHCRVRSADEAGESHVSCVYAVESLLLHAHRACLPMQSSTDGRVWGDGCCQLTDQAVGRWSHCYSPHKHVGHVRHAPWRHTRGGYCVFLVVMLSSAL